MIFFFLIIILQAIWVYYLYFKGKQLEQCVERQRQIIKDQDHKIAELCQPFPDNPIVKDYLKSKEVKLPDIVVKCIQDTFRDRMGIRDE